MPSLAAVNDTYHAFLGRCHFHYAEEILPIMEMPTSHFAAAVTTPRAATAPRRLRQQNLSLHMERGLP